VANYVFPIKLKFANFFFSGIRHCCILAEEPKRLPLPVSNSLYKGFCTTYDVCCPMTQRNKRTDKTRLSRIYQQQQDKDTVLNMLKLGLKLEINKHFGIYTTLYSFINAGHYT
jgi:hypothetical protein